LRQSLPTRAAVVAPIWLVRMLDALPSFPLRHADSSGMELQTRRALSSPCRFRGHSERFACYRSRASHAIPRASTGGLRTRVFAHLTALHRRHAFLTPPTPSDSSTTILQTNIRQQKHVIQQHIARILWALLGHLISCLPLLCNLLVDVNTLPTRGCALLPCRTPQDTRKHYLPHHTGTRSACASRGATPLPCAFYKTTVLGIS